YGEEVDKMIENLVGYYVCGEYLYESWLKEMNLGNFEVEKVRDRLNKFEGRIGVCGDWNEFKGLL
ncbi:hypothetical protein, partial [Bacillus pumilus]|uniref:hypothetical protein n=1 Tax=Bacillus pumilus TaxID=1408 RepID=UPI001C9319C2